MDKFERSKLAKEMASRIELLISSTKRPAAHVLVELGLRGNALSEWKSGKALPSSDAVIKIAHYFDVSTDYILMGTLDSLDEQKFFLPEEYFDFIVKFSKLSENEKKLILNYS